MHLVGFRCFRLRNFLRPHLYPLCLYLLMIDLKIDSMVRESLVLGARLVIGVLVGASWLCWLVPSCGCCWGVVVVVDRD